MPAPRLMTTSQLTDLFLAKINAEGGGGYTKKHARWFLAALFGENGAVTEALCKGNGVRISGAFTFKKIVKKAKKAKPARQGVNPFNGEPTTFKAQPAQPESRGVRVLPAKALRDLVAASHKRSRR